MEKRGDPENWRIRKHSCQVGAEWPQEGCSTGSRATRWNTDFIDYQREVISHRVVRKWPVLELF